MPLKIRREEGENSATPGFGRGFGRFGGAGKKLNCVELVEFEGESNFFFFPS